MKTRGRTELKHYITQSDCLLLRNRLKHVMTADPFAQDDGTYLVSSVYFENINNKILRQKMDGLFTREKFRIRLYNHDTSYIRLEKKSKKNNLCYKQKCLITANEYKAIQHSDLDWMREDSRDLIRELYLKMTLYQLKPMNIVEYKREAFIYRPGNVRVNFDSSLRTSVRNTGVLDPDIPMLGALDPRFVILELKYDDFLPDIIKDLVQIGNRRYLSVSKYVLSRLFG